MAALVFFESKATVVSFIVITTSLIAVIGVGSGQFMNTNDCTCPSDIATFNCNVTGSGFTIWRGSAFDCPAVDSIILLRHSLFANGVMKLCNDGVIIGQSLGVSINSLGNTVYMSQLMVNLTASSNVIGRTVECVYRNPGGMDTLIGSTTLEITDPPPPPSNIQLVGVSPKQLVFNWTTVDSNCSTLKYNVVSNCGTCLDVVERTVGSVTCSIDLSAVINNMMLCSFGVLNVICAGRSSTISIPLDVKLKVPQPPTITSTIPHYNKTDNKLIGIDIKFNEEESFMISNGVDGSALNYTISYTDSNAGDVCYSLTISASSCVQGICTVPSISPLPCSERAGDGNIDITVSATNRLGTGPSSFITIGQTNKYFNITLEMTNKVVCTHLSQQEGQSTVTCDVLYWPCQRQQQQMALTAQGTTSSPNTVNIDLPEFLPRSDYCYAVNASNGTVTILIEGTIESSDQDTTLESCSLSVVISILTVIAILFGLVVATIISITTYWIYKERKRKLTMATGQNISVTGTYITETDNKPKVLLERDGDTIFINLQDKPWQLMQALEAFHENEIDIVDTKIIERTHGYGRISIQCKEAPSDDKVEHIKQHMEFITREEITVLQNTGQQMTYSQSFPPKYGSLYTLLKQVRYIGLINITDIIVRPTTTDPTHRNVTLKFYCEPGYPENWKEEFDRVFTNHIKVCGTDL